MEFTTIKKSGKTTLYADNTKYYDPVKRNIKKIPLDKRYKIFKIKPSFLSKMLRLVQVMHHKNFSILLRIKVKSFLMNYKRIREL